MFRFFPLLCSLLIACPVLAAKIEFGQKFEGHVQLLDSNDANELMQLPLPEGIWTNEVSLVFPLSNDVGTKMRRTNFILVNEGRLVQAIESTVKIEGNVSKWLDEPCKAEPTLFKNQYGTQLWNQRCLKIEAVTFMQGNNANTRSALDSLAKRGIKHEFNSIRASYTRYGDFGKFMEVRFHFFPTNYGFENPIVGLLNTSPWAPHNVASDPSKVKFVQSLMKYMEYVITELDASYSGKPTQNVLKKFSYPEPSKSSGNAGAESVEARLDRLKSLFDKGLIAEAEYASQRNKILGEL